MNPCATHATKTRYPSGPIARMALDKIRKHGASGHKPCRAYQCPSCHGWFLTSKVEAR